MNSGVDEEIRLIRDSARAIAPRSGDLKRIRSLRFTESGFDRTVWQQMGELGWLGLLVPEDAGGAGLGMRCFCALLEELGAGLVPEPLGVCGPAIQILPDRIRDAVIAGNVLVVPAWQETPGSLDIGGSTSFDGQLVCGMKRAVPYAQAADYFLVATRSGCALVPRDARGVSVDAAMTQDGGQYATVTFRDAPGEAVSGDFRPVLDATILASAAYLLGAMEQAFSITLGYLGTRKQFGCLIGSFQALQHRAVDLRTQIELTRAVVQEAADLMDRSADLAICRSAVSRAKARASDAAMQIARETIQFHGAIGITDEADIGLYARKILTLSGQNGSSRAHRACFLAALEVGLSETIEEASTKKQNDGGANGHSRIGRDYNAMTDADFKAEVRSWIEANYPPEIRYPMERLHRRDTKDWYDRLAAKGWLAPRWPREHGGMGLDASKHVIFIEELERYGCSRVNDQGVLMVGPLIMQFGTEEQIKYFLPKILTGEHLWAQGYSEPNAGSDLASLSTRAVLDGEDWVINGQKIWTTLGNDANWMYVLARTDPKAKKQEGISFLLVPMDSPGITVRPILTLSRFDEFCEVFFDNVRVPKDSLVGPVNGGWTMAKALLGHERIFLGSPAQSSFALGRLDQLARTLGVREDPAFRERYAKHAADLADHSALYATFIDKLRRGEEIGAEVSMLKINQTELYKRIAQETADLAAEAAGYVEASDATGNVRVSGLWLHTLQTTIYAGTSEIQRNIVAKQVLGLPG